MGLFKRRHVDTTPEQRYAAETRGDTNLTTDQLRRKAMQAGGRAEFGRDRAVIEVRGTNELGPTYQSDGYYQNDDGTWTHL